MTAQTGVILMCVLWVLLCFRFWSMVGPKNPGQRHLLALAAGLGAGLFYVLGSFIIGILKAPSARDLEPVEMEVGSGAEVRISPPASAVEKP
jgi:hypothetical protein